MIEIDITSLSELRGVARSILDALDGRTVVLLNAPMGGGKTTLAREIASEMGSRDVVTSPTFAIVNEYSISPKGRMYHFDMYRIERLEEAIDLGFGEYIDSGELCLIEWAERVEELLPDDAMMVSIEITGKSSRRFIID